MREVIRFLPTGAITFFTEGAEGEAPTPALVIHWLRTVDVHAPGHPGANERGYVEAVELALLTGDDAVRLRNELETQERDGVSQRATADGTLLPYQPDRVKASERSLLLDTFQRLVKEIDWETREQGEGPEHDD